MAQTKLRWVYMTTESVEEARKIGRMLVEKRLAACVNIIENMTSMFWWEGEVQDGSETVLIAKTQAERMSALVEAVKAVHSYSCPCVVALPIEEGNPDFLEWIREETAAGHQG
ncbi:MAG: divalent-cation tolerance protein CutA [SAR324 cluster bacterium]|nr:divalent-cation tolerance protein CutA [SAR324 cluster bacterium]